jgi:hypothetical protein
MEDVARRTWNGSVPLEERDPDTIIVAPHVARKRRRQDSGVHLDDEIEGFAVNKEDSSGKGRGNSATESNCFQPSSRILTKAVSPASNEGPSPNYGSCSKQHMMEADQTVLLPLGTLRALQNEVQELRSQLLMLKSRTQKQLELFDDALDTRLASPETETGGSDNGGDGFDEAWLEDKAARKVAVKRVRRLAQEHHTGEQRAHLEFMADIVGVNHKSKVDG